MNKNKSAYQVSPKGKIISYDPNYDIERFSFINKRNTLFDKMVDRVNSILNGMVSAKPYEIDWKKVVDGYLETGNGDVPHYASQHVFSYFLLQKRASEKENMQAMYLEIVNALNGEIEKGNLPGSTKK